MRKHLPTLTFFGMWAFLAVAIILGAIGVPMPSIVAMMASIVCLIAFCFSFNEAGNAEPAKIHYLYGEAVAHLNYQDAVNRAEAAQTRSLRLHPSNYQPECVLYDQDAEGA